MLHTDYPAEARRQILNALGEDGRQEAEVERHAASPFEEITPSSLGRVSGYRYRKNGTAYMLALPGETAQAQEWFMDLTSGFPVDVQAGDWLAFTDGTRRRVSCVQPSGGFGGGDVYRLYRLEVC